MKKILAAILVMVFFVASQAQTTSKKIILQCFWWDYKNDNYPAGWANYLAELAPRLKGLGIDAVWIPPNVKNEGGTGSVGYAPFDNYDLGDKYQKGTTKTGMGNKDELLRLIAIMHANGIEVIQDVVGNHLIGAGDTVSGSGLDPDAWDNQYKIFRYSSYATPLALGTIDEYRQKQGRFPKNWQNFHPNPADNCNSGDICQEFFGPDISYADGASGQTNVTPVYDPNQTTYNPYNTGGTTGASGNGYMRRHTREWLGWYKKQLGFDGVRLDATKNYDYPAAEDFLYNMQFNSGWASGGNTMLSIGEIVGSATDEDNWANAVQNRAGTFDFNLRYAIKDMADNNGFYNMANLPAAQQNQRVIFYASDNTYVHRTVTFVNNHDTFRPILDANGNYTGSWDTGHELANGHIDPVNNARLALSYAAIMAMDGNVQVFFEDLFNVGNTSKRFSHLPTSTTDLPTRSPLETLIWCHQNLDFKDGSYKVRSTVAGGNVFFNSGSSDNDLLVIERSNKALIGLNDRGDAWQSAYVDSDFPPGTVLKDYSGANGTATYTVPADQRVLVNVPPVDAANNLWGFAVWAPIGAAPSANYTPQASTTTTQEWELADDLGDSHCGSLGQGGQLPAASTHHRVAGKIFASAGNTVTYTIIPEASTANITASIWDNNGNKLDEVAGSAGTASPLVKNYIPAADGWLVIKLRNTDLAQPAQKCLVKMSYKAPDVVNTALAANSSADKISIWSGNKNSTDITDCGNWEEGLIPAATSNVYVPAYSTPFPQFSSNATVNNITIEDGAQVNVDAGVTLTVTGDWNNLGATSTCGTVSFAGTALQHIKGTNTFCTLEANNSQHIFAEGDNTITQQLQLTNGNINIEGHQLTMAATATLVGGSAGSYIQTEDVAGSTASFTRYADASATLFPVGNSNYTPVTITNNGTAMNFSLRNFASVLVNGTSGPAIASNDKVNKTWVITHATTGANADITLQWNMSNQDLAFNRLNCYGVENSGTNWQTITPQSVAAGTNPFTITATGVMQFVAFAVYGKSAVLPVQLVSFAGVYAQQSNTLRWTIASQLNVKGYYVQFSSDGLQFTSIGFVGASNSSSYSFTHKTNNAYAKSYYRLKMVDLDGKFAWSNTIVIASPVKNKFIISPNPAPGHFVVTANQEIIGTTMHIVNAEAVLLGAAKGNSTQLTAALNRQLQKAANGIYFIRFINSDGIQVVKLIKQ